MSITFDTERWSNLSLAREIEPRLRRSSAPALVTLKELGFFKANPEARLEALFPFIEEEDLEPARQED